VTAYLVCHTAPGSDNKDLELHQNNICEACGQNPIEVLIADDDADQPYQVCNPCALRLRTMALRPLEWFNLAAIHGPRKYLLHDDLYSDGGVAELSEDPVVDTDLYPMPQLEQISHDLERVIDFAVTQYYISNDVFDTLRTFEKTDVLQAIKRRCEASTNFNVVDAMFEICARVVGEVAEEWIRKQWSSYQTQNLYFLADATAYCLPFDEGFARVSSALEHKDLKELTRDCHAFAPFRSEKTLDWMETHHTILQHDSWGHLAALSHLSWNRAKKWLRFGRPLSFRALEAIIACHHYNTALLKRDRPTLENPAPLEDMIEELERHRTRDPVPNVRKKIDYIEALLQSPTPIED